MRISNNRRILHWISNFWGMFYIAFIVMNFFLQNQFDFLVGPFSALYVGTLTIYVGSKEFDRWYSHHESRRRGELFVVVFTVVMAALLAGALLLGPGYRVPSDIVATYIGVLSLFVLTQKSKRFHETERER